MMGKKRLMVLGVGDAQVNLIKAAHDLEYFVIACDMRAEKEGAKLADHFYQVNYINREAILEIAKEEHIDGIISNSEPAMLNVAFIAETLGLPGNTMESVDALLSKAKFRDLQERMGVFSPEHYVVQSVEELIERAKNIRYPVIIKPVESSGTRGTTKLDKFSEIDIGEAYRVCRDFSRNNLVAIEEYVEMKSLRVIGVEVFVIGDEILWDGWYWQDRAKETPMLPMMEIYPMDLPEEKKKSIQDIVTRIIRGSGIRLGEYNVETYYTTKDEIFVIEINPRQAGNYIPQLIKQHTGVDLTKLLVSTAVGDMSYYEELKTYKRQNNFVTHQVVFSKETGIFKELYIDPEIKLYVKWIDQIVKPGEEVVKGINAAEAVAYVDMQFDDYETQHRFTDDIERYIYPVLQKVEK